MPYRTTDMPFQDYQKFLIVLIVLVILSQIVFSIPDKALPRVLYGKYSTKVVMVSSLANKHNRRCGTVY